MTDSNEPVTATLAETDNLIAWRAEEPDGEVTYHLELNNVTLHFYQEEWDEFKQLMQSIVSQKK